MRTLTILWLLMVSAAAQDVVVIEQERGSDAHLRQVLKEGLDEALKDQVKHLFQIWLSAGGQAARTKIGMNKAIDAYRRALVAVDQSDLRAQIDETFKVQSESSRPFKLKPRAR